MSGMLRAVRGATTVDVDERTHVLDRTRELVLAVLERNGLVEDDAGITHVPLLCAQELDVAGAVPRCVRVLVHAHTSRPRDELRHVYLHGARQLRTDLPE